MKNFHTFFVFLALSFVCLSTQAQLQIGLGAAAGKNFSTLDYELANASNYEERSGFSGQWSLEVAYLLNERWRISLGASSVLHSIGVKRDGTPFFNLSDEVSVFHIPFEAHYRVPVGKKHYLVFRGGGSLATSKWGLARGGRSSSILLPVQGAEGATVMYEFESGQSLAGYLRLGVGQEWVFRGRRSSSIQLSLLYVQGFSNLLEGNIDYWDVPSPQGISTLDAIGAGMMPEPAETYPRFFSQGSYLCVELKFYMGLTRNQETNKVQVSSTKNSLFQ